MMMFNCSVSRTVSTWRNMLPVGVSFGLNYVWPVCQWLSPMSGLCSCAQYFHVHSMSMWSSACRVVITYLYALGQNRSRWVCEPSFCRVNGWTPFVSLESRCASVAFKLSYLLLYSTPTIAVPFSFCIIVLHKKYCWPVCKNVKTTPVQGDFNGSPIFQRINFCVH